MYDAQTPHLRHSPHANGFAWSDLGDQTQSPGGNYRLDGSRTGGQCKAVAGGIQTRSYKSVATQRCQLCHYNIVVAQLAALGFIKHVAAGSKPAYR